MTCAGISRIVMGINQRSQLEIERTDVLEKPGCPSRTGPASNTVPVAWQSPVGGGTSGAAD
jgi:hypothetical protein